MLPKGTSGARNPVLDQLDSRLSQGAGVSVDDLGLPPAQRQALPDLLKDNPGYTYWEYQGKGFIRRTPQSPDLVTTGRPPDSTMKADSDSGSPDIDDLQEFPSSPLAPGRGLQAHENAGGHTLAPKKAHVAATDQQLRDRLGPDPKRGPPSASFVL